MVVTICEVIVSVMLLGLSMVAGNWIEVKCQRYYWIPPAGFFVPLFVWVGILAVWFECLL